MSGTDKMRFPNRGDIITLDPRVVVRVESEIGRCQRLREDDREARRTLTRTCAVAVARNGLDGEEGSVLGLSDSGTSR